MNNQQNKGWTTEQLSKWQSSYSSPTISFNANSPQMPSPTSHTLHQYSIQKPLYTSVLQSTPTIPQSVPTTAWPQSLKQYVKRVYETCPPQHKTLVESHLRSMIKDLQLKNAIFTTNWDSLPLPKECIIPAPMPIKVPSILTPSHTTISYSPIQSPIDPESSIKESRLKRFNDSHAFEEKKKRKAVKEVQKVRAAAIRAGAEGNPDVIDWDSETIIGTCQVLEKSYLRITSAVDPSTVRPLRVLEKTLTLLTEKWKKEANYTYICDQLKSLRQDLTVQRIKNGFTVKVYETHARIAIEKGDLGEFNQCQGQLKELYSLHKLNGQVDEFLGYRILYMIHTNNKTELMATLTDLSESQKQGKAVSHALKVRSAVATSNYFAFFSHYKNAPYLSCYLMDQFVERERIKTMKTICGAFRPSFPISKLNLGFMSTGETFAWLKKIGISVHEGELNTKEAYSVFLEMSLEMSFRKVDIKGQL